MRDNSAQGGFRRAAILVSSLGFGFFVAACTTQAPGTQIPFDVGNMATPEPLPQGVVSRTSVSGKALETGNMAYPVPLPQGNLSTTRLP